jgi:hypothetical protein
MPWSLLRCFIAAPPGERSSAAREHTAHTNEHASSPGTPEHCPPTHARTHHRAQDNAETATKHRAIATVVATVRGSTGTRRFQHPPSVVLEPAGPDAASGPSSVVAGSRSTAMGDSGGCSDRHDAGSTRHTQTRGESHASTDRRSGSEALDSARTRGPPLAAPGMNAFKFTVCTGACAAARHDAAQGLAPTAMLDTRKV